MAQAGIDTFGAVYQGSVGGTLEACHNMTGESQRPPSASDLLQSSALYRRFQAEREEIMKHKWYESEKAGHDIGFDHALTDWAIKHRSEWLKSWKEKTQEMTAPMS